MLLGVTREEKRTAWMRRRRRSDDDDDAKEERVRADACFTRQPIRALLSRAGPGALRF